ncbi:MAG: haloacid dehalogenase-like hydrolase [Candidatus Electrothrix sp. AR4]|nr:haloacid dehalogenase-like hydrolase [Candidatus Electrothrix sp. AR4]
MSIKIAFFDFDGTVTKSDSLIGFIQYAVGKPSYYFGLLSMSPVLALYKLNIISNHLAKEKLLNHFFNGWDAVHFKKIADQYAVEQIDTIIRPRAMEKIRWHQAEGHEVVIVSASIESWMKKWCKNNKIHLIATRLETNKGKLTGKFSTKNCYGIEKVNRIEKKFNLSHYSTIYAYGDSLGDEAMLNIATERYYRYFE